MNGCSDIHVYSNCLTGKLSIMKTKRMKRKQGQESTAILAALGGCTWAQRALSYI